jgi:hypothetical protein
MFIITNSAVRFPFLHMLFITIVVSTSLDHLHFCLLDSHQTLGTEDFFFFGEESLYARSAFRVVLQMS